MDNLVLASPEGIFNMFGWGFLAGSLFGFTIMMIFEMVISINRKSEQSI